MPITKSVRTMIRSQVRKARNLDKKVVKGFVAALTGVPRVSPYNYGLVQDAAPGTVEQLHNIDQVQDLLDLECFPFAHSINDDVCNNF
jgi:hypothetical protein